MVTSLEKKILKYLRASPKRRAKYCEKFHEKIVSQTGLNIRQELVGALEFILRDVDPQQPQRIGVLIEGSLQQRIKGHPHYQSGLMQYSVSVGRVSGTFVYLPHPAPTFLDARIELTAKKAEVTWSSHGKTIKRSSF